MSGNWIKLHRKLLDSEVASDMELLGCWTWLLLNATWKERRLNDGTMLKKGQILVTFDQLARAWNCSKSTAHARTQKLTKTERISNENRTQGTVITICNWETYQNTPDTPRTKTEQHPNENRTTSERYIRKKKEKKVKKEKKLETTSLSSTGRPTAQEFFDRWNAFVSDKPKLKGAVKLSDARRRKICTRLRENDWWPTFQAIVHALPLTGEGWQPDLDWLIRNEENVYLILEGKYDWRVDSKAGKKLAEQKRLNAARDRERRVEEEKKACKAQASGTRKAIENTLVQKGGDDDGTQEKSLLFG